MSESSVSLSNGGKTSAFSVFVFIGSNPVDSSVSSNGFVEWVNEDDFVEFVCAILTNPVRVEDSKVSASLSYSVFSDSSVGSAWLELVDTLVNGFTVNDTLANWSLSSTSSDSDSVDDITLLSLVTELSGLVWSGGSLDLVDDGKLSVFP